MELKEVMKSRRKMLNISQKDLAEMAEISLATVLTSSHLWLDEVSSLIIS